MRLPIAVPGVVVGYQTASTLRRLLTLERRHDAVARAIPKIPISTGEANGQVDVIGNALPSGGRSPREVEGSGPLIRHSQPLEPETNRKVDEPGPIRRSRSNGPTVVGDLALNLGQIRLHGGRRRVGQGQVRGGRHLRRRRTPVDRTLIGPDETTGME